MSAVSELLDAHGCLSPAGLDALRKAAPGQAPHDAAAHVAACTRCQKRLLSEGGPGALHTGKPRPTQAPPPWRTAIVMLAAILLVVGVFLSLRFLTSPT